MTRQYSQRINQLRAVGAIWVFGFHYYHFVLRGYFEQVNTFNPFELLIYHGYFIVYLFFAMSGFLFAKNYKDQLDIKLFIRKRMVTILPPYYICLLMYCILFANHPSIVPLLLSPFSIDITVYDNMMGHLWFINRLLICYLCFPIFWFFHKKSGFKGLICLWTALVLSGLYWNIKEQVPLDALYGSLPLCVSHFLLAVIVGFYFEKKEHANKVIALLLSIFVLGLIGFHQVVWMSSFSYAKEGVFWFYFLTVWFAFFIHYYNEAAFRLPHVLNAFLNQLGKLSYSIYLYHFLVIQFVLAYEVPLFSNIWVGFLVLFVVTCAVAYFVKFLFSMAYATYQMLISFWGVKN